MHILRLATRGSQLALKQSHLTAEYLKAAIPGLMCELYPVHSMGDLHREWSLEAQGGEGLFVKELESALLNEEAELAVHSAKDMPCARMPEGLVLAGYLPRGPVEDVLVHRKGTQLNALKHIGSSSPRRRTQLSALLPEASWQPIRGNVETRLEKVTKGEMDATVLAAAGLFRLGFDAAQFPELTFNKITTEKCVPAAGQGAIALQCAPELAEKLHPLLCKATFMAVELERAYLAELGAGCQTPHGAYCCGQHLHVFHNAVGEVRSYAVDVEDDTSRQAAIQAALADAA